VGGLHGRVVPPPALLVGLSVVVVVAGELVAGRVEVVAEVFDEVLHQVPDRALRRG
jgi:hypothetical protein